MEKHSIAKLGTLMLSLLMVGTGAYATEGRSIYPMGVENYMAGALPPPGLYGMVYGNYYKADRLNDGSGNAIPVPDFKITATAITPRVAWVSGKKVLGGDLVFHAILPIVNLKAKATLPGLGTVDYNKTGVADMTTGVGVGYHHSHNLHSVIAINAMWPTGKYDKNSPFNIGTNHTAVEPVYLVSYIDPAGPNADARIGYIINQNNKDTNYKSGQELHVDYAAGWGFGNGWTAGVGGYYLQQTTSDSGSGVTNSDNKTRAFAIGPSIKYDSGKGWFLTAKWEKESMVKNTTQGNEFWVKATFPF
jgi:hypothetical protein